MRSLILAALLALPVPAIASLPVNEDVHYFEFYRCSMLVTTLIVTQNDVYPIPDMDALTRSQRADVEMARGYAEAQGNAYRVEMPARGKCHQI